VNKVEDMSSVDSLDAVMTKILKLYDKNPQGWKILIGRDEAGYGSILIQTPEELWEIKVDSLWKPNPIGLGARIDKVGALEQIVGESPHFGFRPVPKDYIKTLKEALENHKPIDDIIKSLLSQKPATINRLSGHGMLSGPVIYRPDIPFISDKQLELDVLLRRNLNTMLNRRGISSMYA
jgi:hypothetical protein